MINTFILERRYRYPLCIDPYICNCDLRSLRRSSPQYRNTDLPDAQWTLCFLEGLQAIEQNEAVNRILLSFSCNLYSTTNHTLCHVDGSLALQYKYEMLKCCAYIVK